MLSIKSLVEDLFFKRSSFPLELKVLGLSWPLNKYL